MQRGPGDVDQLDVVVGCLGLGREVLRTQAVGPGRHPDQVAVVVEHDVAPIERGPLRHPVDLVAARQVLDHRLLLALPRGVPHVGDDRCAPHYDRRVLREAAVGVLGQGRQDRDLRAVRSEGCNVGGMRPLSLRYARSTGPEVASNRIIEARGHGTCHCGSTGPVTRARHRLPVGHPFVNNSETALRIPETIAEYGLCTA